MTGQSKFQSKGKSASSTDVVDEDIEGLMRRAVVASTDSDNPIPNLPLWVEGVVVGGIALGVYVLPPLARFLTKKAKAAKVRMGAVTGRIRILIADKWEPINRRRKRGSIVRVVASVLPDMCFNPPCRMFIPSAGYQNNSWRSPIQSYNLPHKQERFPPSTTNNDPDEEFTYTQDALDGPTINQDGLIVAFAINDGESDCTELDTVEIEDTCSNPEGWDPIFQPRANSTRFACSTPEPSCRSSCLNDSFSTQNSEVDNKHDVKEELADLKNMVKQLLFQFGNLNQTNNRTASLFGDNSTLQQYIEQISSANNVVKTGDLSSSVTVPKPPLPPPFPAASQNSSPTINIPGPPAPPPPPPPPMPSMTFTGSVPLITPRKTGASKPKPTENKPGGCVSINLKDIKGVQLRPTPKSPGGTPLKNASLSAHSSSTLDLTDVLKKRYQAWHSPTPSEKDFGDKENGEEEESAFDDSFMDDEEQQKLQIPVMTNTLRPTLKDKDINKARSAVRMSNENQVPFGQHLLKKGNNNSPLEMHPIPRIKVLAEQNI